MIPISFGPLDGSQAVRNQLHKDYDKLRIRGLNMGGIPTGYHEYVEALRESLDAFEALFPSEVPAEEPKPRRAKK